MSGRFRNLAQFRNRLFVSHGIKDVNSIKKIRNYQRLIVRTKGKLILD